MLHVSDDASHGYLVSRYEQDRTSSKPKMVARSDSVPAMVRTVKVVPFLACDNAGYVLGGPRSPGSFQTTEGRRCSGRETQRIRRSTRRLCRRQRRRGRPHLPSLAKGREPWTGAKHPSSR